MLLRSSNTVIESTDRRHRDITSQLHDMMLLSAMPPAGERRSRLVVSACMTRCWNKTVTAPLQNEATHCYSALNNWWLMHTSDIHCIPETSWSPCLPRSIIGISGATRSVPPVRVVFIPVRVIDVISEM